MEINIRESGYCIEFQRFSLEMPIPAGFQPIPVLVFRRKMSVKCYAQLVNNFHQRTKCDELISPFFKSFFA